MICRKVFSEKFSVNFATILYLNRVERITRLTAIDLIRNYVNGTWKDTPLQVFFQLFMVTSVLLFFLPFTNAKLY